MTDELPAPVPGTDKVDETLIQVAPDTMASTAADDSAAQNSSFNRTVAALRAQPERRIRVTKEQAPVFYNINGVKGWLQEGVHMVPDQIATLLEEAGHYEHITRQDWALIGLRMDRSAPEPFDLFPGQVHWISRIDARPDCPTCGSAALSATDR